MKTDVINIGAGPTGLTLGIALLQRGIKTVLVDRLAVGQNTSRAAVIHARTLEVLKPLGVTQQLVEKGVHARRFSIRDRDRTLVPIDFQRLPTDYPYALMVSQATTEAILLRRFQKLGGTILRPRTLQSLEQDSTGVTVRLDDGSQHQARYVVGADGMHSTVRQMLGIPFVGASYAESFALADVRLTGELPHDEVILFFSPAGMVVVAPLPDGQHRIVATTDDAPQQPDIKWLQGLLDARGPQHERLVVQEVIWGSRFHLHHRIAAHYRSGRVLLAGDAAHVHSPAGGQGMNAGILDAVALAEALAHALEGDAKALDHYGEVRRPIAKKIVALADRLTRLATVRPGLRPLRNSLMSLFGRNPMLRRKLAYQLSGLTYR